MENGLVEDIRMLLTSRSDASVALVKECLWALGNVFVKAAPAQIVPLINMRAHEPLMHYLHSCDQDLHECICLAVIALITGVVDANCEAIPFAEALRIVVQHSDRSQPVRASLDLLSAHLRTIAPHLALSSVGLDDTAQTIAETTVAPAETGTNTSSDDIVLI
jgi:hypothetical protein